jgi:preprotein translocase subunit YajC
MSLWSLVIALQQAVEKSGSGGASSPATPAKPTGLFSSPDMLILPLAFILIFYFLMWRPQARERKNREAMFKGIKKGDQVLLSCGLVGEVAALTEQDVLVRFDDKDPRRMRFRKFAIQSVLSPDEKPAEPAEAASK